MTYTEVHANFCEQQITVRKVLVLSDTLDIRHHAACIYFNYYLPTCTATPTLYLYYTLVGVLFISVITIRN